MSAAGNDLVFYGSANMPDGDGVTTGGAVDFTKLIVFSDISPTGTMDYVSSSSGDTTQSIVLTGRDSTGLVVTENITFNGQTPDIGTQSFERLLKGVITGTAAGDLAAISHTPILSGRTAQSAANETGATEPYIQLQAGDGTSVAVGQIIRLTNNTPSGVQYKLRRIVRISGDFAYVNRDWSTIPSSATQYSVHEGMLFDLSPNQIKEVRRAFYSVTSDILGGSTRTFYEKIFAVDNDTVTSLTNVVISKQADPSGGTLEFALTTARNDTGTVANRQTAPVSGITAFTTGAAPQSINVPSPQALLSGAAPNAAGAQGIWLSFQLPAGQAAAKTSFQLRIAGQST